MIAAAADPVVLHLATHPLVLALPAVIPAFLVVGVVIAIAIADRRRGDDDEDAGDDADAEDKNAEDAGGAGEDTPGDSARTTHPDPTDPANRNEADDPAREAD
ncbi:hypothetical protein GDN83_15475 [Gordonia jinghuaiqii]|uniref:Uncharacterized protein n=1 Tax=Gordonia jinghuaiqii TaxID=2758710 RepID=A0A7D7R2G2_9ACTN|nr:hypothetical protein [Gordonia jinghuaiqii]MCR5979114.1 hypothetical protein [Gordonia jinghuaiqii]QMT01567.1 hypothetical protein H1R19_22630 [Gordonia jinghuaiqii]